MLNKSFLTAYCARSMRGSVLNAVQNLAQSRALRSRNDHNKRLKMIYSTTSLNGYTCLILQVNHNINER